MSLAGKGAVAIWHDIAPEGRDEFYAWHGQEHMPERVAIPGFLRGRRYVAANADLEFFNLYEAENPDVLKGPDYRERLENPTPWTVAAVKHFRNVARSICTVAATTGRAQGGLMATWRYDVADSRAEEHRRILETEILPALALRPGIAGAHLLVADVEASEVDTAEQRARSERNRVPRWVVLAEGWGDERPFEAACRDTLSHKVLTDLGARGDLAFGTYRLQASRTKTPSTLG
jgi:hypothetical protein